MPADKKKHTTSKFFAIASEGDTTDGRAISAQHIQEMADSYNPATYGARIWLEHIRGVFHDGPFKAYGDITELKAEKADGKLKLFAKIDPTPELVAINKARQKIYSSVEISPNFANTGGAYLMGLGVTDSPASLGTDMLKFSTTTEHNPLAARKQDPSNVFSAAQETVLEFETATDTDPADSLFSKIKTLLAGNDQKAKNDHQAFAADLTQAVEAIADSQKDLLESYATLAAEAELLGALGERLDAMQEALDERDDQYKALLEQLDTTPSTHSSRGTSTGPTGDSVQTDC